MASINLKTDRCDLSTNMQVRPKADTLGELPVPPLRFPSVMQDRSGRDTTADGTPSESHDVAAMCLGFRRMVRQTCACVDHCPIN
jgi:hypothetical protein